MLTHEEAVKIFTQAGALLNGHFILTSGRHSNQYMQCALVLQYPQYTEKLARHLAEKFQGENVDIVIGPAMGGIIVAYEVGRQFGVPAIFTERKDGIMQLRRGFTIKPGQKVLVVEDVVTTGGSVREVIEVVEKSGGIVVGVGVLVDRSGGSVDFGVRKEAVLTMHIESFEPDNCPLCREGLIPAVKPGSRS
ncbi:orotate phosphoribosyltransferase [Thermosyntropha lipolytica DSM 11003]|uniref:Orotate phosphoribosyltransferase n=1 Tax=Thermosyntropha lipolytica DSM 11003 TaxID=1123382 RepID=A0A1M5PWI8_9FIRM|nr:orotate phosphoribosyltransferase [Thermosyntropha lipolytica]SHH06387.1 orotate phosphoribosyltransferase [Thermosyntropha lipolytica DSM 11003]